MTEIRKRVQSVSQHAVVHELQEEGQTRDGQYLDDESDISAPNNWCLKHKTEWHVLSPSSSSS